MPDAQERLRELQNDRDRMTKLAMSLERLTEKLTDVSIEVEKLCEKVDTMAAGRIADLSSRLAVAEERVSTHQKLLYIAMAAILAEGLAFIAGVAILLLSNGMK